MINILRQKYKQIEIVMKIKNPAEKKEITRALIIRTIKEYAKMIGVVFIITSSLIQGSRVPTGSMETTIMIGDWVMNNKLAYDLTTPRNIPFTDIELPYVRLIKWSDPKPNDIVVFQFPGMREQIKDTVIQNYVKRCVAVAGDTVKVIDRVLYVNGKEFPRPPHIQYLRNTSLPVGYVDPEIFPKGIEWNGDNYGPLVIPKKGDVIKLTLNNLEQWKTFINREYLKEVVSVSDGKIFIDGKETNNYTVQDDYYFMMGDNRDNSLDCRYWGFVPRRNVIGKPMFVYFSWNSDIPFSDFFNLVSSIRLDRIGKFVY
jgi:signal peptidase I